MSFSFVFKIFLSSSRFILEFFLQIFRLLNNFLFEIKILISGILKSFNSQKISQKFFANNEDSQNSKIRLKILENLFILKNFINQKIFLSSFFDQEHKKSQDFDKNLFFEKCFLSSDGENFQEFIENFQEYINSEETQDLKKIIEFDMLFLLENIVKKSEELNFLEKNSEFSQIIEFEILFQLNLILFSSIYLIFEQIFELIPRSVFEIQDLENVLEFQNLEKSFVFQNLQIVKNQRFVGFIS